MHPQGGFPSSHELLQAGLGACHLHQLAKQHQEYKAEGNAASLQT